MLKTVVLVMIASALGGVGHVLLSKGMRTIGDLTEAPTMLLGGMAMRAVLNPWVIAGVGLQAAFFAMYLTLLSRDDLSKILPMTALDYIVVAIFAQAVLAEVVTPVRWAGIGCIVLGVWLVSRA